MADVFARGASVLHSQLDPDARPADAQKPNHAGPLSPWLRYVSWSMPVLLLIVWELFARLGALSPNVLPAPSKVALTALACERGTSDWRHGRESAARRNRLRDRWLDRVRARHGRGLFQSG